LLSIGTLLFGLLIFEKFAYGFGLDPSPLLSFFILLLSGYLILEAKLNPQKFVEMLNKVLGVKTSPNQPLNEGCPPELLLNRSHLKIYLLSKRLLLLVVFTGVFLNIFYISRFSGTMMLILTALWLLAAKRHKLNNKATVMVAIFLFGLCPFFLILKKDLIAEKTAAWAYIFLIASVGQMIPKLKNEEKALV